jgi:hypothetical protein
MQSIVSDTTTLIVLGKLGRYDLLQNLYTPRGDDRVESQAIVLSFWRRWLTLGLYRRRVG